MSRKERIDYLIESKAVSALQGWFDPARKCWCMGPEGDEPECQCRMTIKQIESRLDIDALKRGELSERK